MTEAQADQLIDLLSALHTLGLDIRTVVYWLLWWVVMLGTSFYIRGMVRAATRSTGMFGGTGRSSE